MGTAVENQVVVYPGTGAGEALSMQDILCEAGKVPGLRFAGGPGEGYLPQLAFSGPDRSFRDLQENLKDSGWTVNWPRPVGKEADLLQKVNVMTDDTVVLFRPKTPPSPKEASAAAFRSYGEGIDALPLSNRARVFTPAPVAPRAAPLLPLRIQAEHSAILHFPSSRPQ